jgi:hypothetical protein
MARKLVVGCLLIAAVAGCRVCDHPYDYCGPVIDSNYHPLGPRAGSVMHGDGAPIEAIPAPPPIPTPPASAPSDSGVVPGDSTEMPGTDTGFVLPHGDSPPAMGDMETISVMRSRLRYAR